MFGSLHTVRLAQGQIAFSLQLKRAWSQTSWLDLQPSVRAVLSTLMNCTKEKVTVQWGFLLGLRVGREKFRFVTWLKFSMFFKAHKQCLTSNTQTKQSKSQRLVKRYLDKCRLRHI